MKELIAVVFSKNRALQLDLCLRSLIGYANPDNITVLYKTTDDRHKSSYEKLSKFYEQYDVNFVEEQNFKNDLVNILKGYKKVLFCVDDTVFIKPFSLNDCAKVLDEDFTVLGVSLRLGMNTTYCYSMDMMQPLPEFQKIEKLLKFDWATSQHDFGYPLELSSSIYRCCDLNNILELGKYDSPNSFEWVMYLNSRIFANARPNLCCYEGSVAFSIPANKVQDENNNRFSKNDKYDPENLLKLFEDGKYIYLAIFNGFVPNSCHCEFDILKEIYD